MALIVIAAWAMAAQDTPSVSINLDKATVAVPRSLFGVFFEEINNAGEGGLYAELLSNRGMLRGNAGLPEGWKSVSKSVTFDAQAKLNESSAGSIILNAKDSSVAVENGGFWGIPVRSGKRLAGSIWVKGTGSLSVALAGAKGSALSNSVKVQAASSWKEVPLTFFPISSDSKAKLVITAEKGSSVSIGYASLMPVNTWKNRTNGLRPDLAERIAQLEPGFLRFPGGCYVEGNNLGNAFEWRGTLAPIEKRPGTPWSFWGYTSSNGLGYHEYLQLCEDVQAEPMFVINCGMSHSEITPMDKMDRHVKDALDAIEYANGPVSSKMGALRAANGHPKSFNLKYVEIGNENGYSWSFGGPAPYYERFKLINEAIKAKHPEIVTISNVEVPSPGDLTSEHYYDTPRWFWANKDRYNTYNRNGNKVYIGEYAVTRDNGRGSLAGALGEAAFMTGMERNADIVAMGSYAPLFENINNRQWNPNAIVFDGTRSYGTPSYWVQQMFASNRTDLMFDSKAVAPPTPPQPVAGGFGLKTWNTAAEFKDVKVVINGKTEYSAAIPKLTDLADVRGDWKVEDGGLRQTAEVADRHAVIKGITAKATDDWTFEFTAKTLSGREGFLASFAIKPSGEFAHWNLGGWNNTEHGFERGGRVGANLKGKIELGKWYQVRLVKQGEKVLGYLDGKLLQTFAEGPGPSDLAASTGIDIKRKELVLKLVSGANSDRVINLSGLSFKPNEMWSGQILSHALATAENSLDQPNVVIPRTIKLKAAKTITLPPNSLLILRVPASENLVRQSQAELKKRNP
jgi:alpha-L-arabinofuranosidase